MFTVPDWCLTLSVSFRNGSDLLYEDVDKGLQMGVWSPKQGEQQVVYAFKADPQGRTFADEDDMIRAYEKSPDVLCAICGAINEVTAAEGGGDSDA